MTRLIQWITPANWEALETAINIIQRRVITAAERNLGLASLVLPQVTYGKACFLRFCNGSTRKRMGCNGTWNCSPASCSPSFTTSAAPLWSCYRSCCWWAMADTAQVFDALPLLHVLTPHAALVRDVWLIPVYLKIQSQDSVRKQNALLCPH